MGIAVNHARCKKCGDDIIVILEWRSKQEAIKEIQETKCTKCGSDEWSFTDNMGQS